jgi:hypothetical protein
VEPLYYTIRFIDGFRDDIKFLVVAQRPKELDTACCLALLQEVSKTILSFFFSSAQATHASKEWWCYWHQEQFIGAKAAMNSGQGGSTVSLQDG